MDPLLTLSFAFDVYSSLLLLWLLVTYYRNYQQMKMKFTLGLLFFALFLLLRNLTAIYANAMMMEIMGGFGTGAAFMLSILQAAGLSALAWITWRP